MIVGLLRGFSPLKTATFKRNHIMSLKRTPLQLGKIIAIRSAFLAVIVIFGFAGTATCQKNLKKVSLIPMWTPQAQFAGYYVACEKGIYENHGLDVTIIQGGPESPPDQLLKTGKADFAVMWLSSGIRERSYGTPLVNIAQMNQRSSLMLVARKSSGINSPPDMNGKKVSIWEGDLSIQPKAFIKKYNLHVTIIPQGYSVDLFLRGGVDVVSAMWYNEYHTILNSGIDTDELTTFFYDKYGLNFPEDGIYTMETTFEKDSGECRAFVDASIEGWKYAFAHEKETLDIILKYMKEAGLPANRVHQKWMLEKIKELMMPDGVMDIKGALNKEDYKRVSAELLKFGELKHIPDFDHFYKPAIEKR